MYLGLVLIVMIVSGTFILLSLQNIEISKAKQQLRRYADRVSEQVVQNGEEAEFQNGLMNTVTDAVGIQGNILNLEGETIASTTALQPPYPIYKNSAIVAAMSGSASYSIGKKSRDASDLVKEWMSYAVPVKDADENVKYIIFTRMDASSMQSSLNQTTRTIVIAVALALLLATVMGYIFAQTLTGPVLALTRGAKNLAEGDLNQQLVVKSDDEIGQLTLSFNNMAAELAKNMMEVSTEKNKLEIILHNMTDGVISFDRDGRLMHANSACLGMLGVEKLDLTFSGFIHAYDIDSGVYLEVEPENSKKINFPVGNKYLSASFAPYSSKKEAIEGVVVVLQDITEQKKLDDMRKEFVANVSHEMRTPLTTVKSYTETLLDGAIEEKELAMEFLGIINNEADRMSFLVQDLLQLSRFDNKQVKLSMSEIHLNGFLTETMKRNRIHAENKHQHLSFEPYPVDISVFADKERISQVVNNIVSNAIKYSLAEADIRIIISEDPKYVKIAVKDTGMGIHREDLPRIFERFYRVDKARSRAMGGTGLGLAIAKEIMELHHGRLTVESEYGKGTTMTMWFLRDMPLDELDEDLNGLPV